MSETTFDPELVKSTYSISTITFDIPENLLDVKFELGTLRYCTEEDFIKVNAGNIWKEKFPDGKINNGFLLCDNLHDI